MTKEEYCFFCFKAKTLFERSSFILYIVRPYVLYQKCTVRHHILRKMFKNSGGDWQLKKRLERVNISSYTEHK